MNPSTYQPQLDLTRRDDLIFAALQQAGFSLNEAMHERLCVEVFCGTVTETTPLPAVMALLAKRTAGRTRAQITHDSAADDINYHLD